MKKSDRQENNVGELYITAPMDAVFGLYRGVPTSKNYFKAINTENAIDPTSVFFLYDVKVYYYKGLEVGLYHYGASMDGYTAVCQILNYTEEKRREELRLEVKLEKMAGNGYEPRYVMLNTEEFINAQLHSNDDTWGKEYVHLFKTPQFLRPRDYVGRHQQTTNEELWRFINDLHKKSSNMYVFSLGKSPKYSFDMPLVVFTKENIEGKSLEEVAKILRANGKPTVQYVAQIHANEPVSAEGALAMMLDLTNSHGEHLLDGTDVYIIPRINIDGAVEVIREAPTTMQDMNRDYMRMNNWEIRTVVGVYNLFLPEVCIDGHEKGTDVLTTDSSRCTDMELQVGAGSLNHPAEMTALGMDIALTGLKKGRELGLRCHFYTNLASAMGGSAGSSYFGARNSVSFLIETPGGTTLGTLCMQRRVMAQYVFASTAISYTVKNAKKVMDTVHSSREKMARTNQTYDESNLIVLEHGKEETGSFAVQLINVPTGEVIDEAYEIPYAEHTVAQHYRTRPTAYVIPKGLVNEETILSVAKCHLIDFYEIPEGKSVSLVGYHKDESGVSLTEERCVYFDTGAYVFPNTVPSTVLSILMEPDFNAVSKRKMSLLSMELISPDENGLLPVYRYCHDLENAKIALD